MATDTDTARSTMTLAGGSLGFCGAVIAFVNSRLQAASTTDAKQKLYAHLFSGLEVALWIGGCIASFAFDSLRVGIWFFLFGFILHCFVFAYGRGLHFRTKLLLLVLSLGLMFMLPLVLLILRVVKAIDDLTHIITSIINK